MPCEKIFIQNSKQGAILRLRTNVASVGSVFNDTRKVKVLSLPETTKEKSTFRAKAVRRELVDFSFMVVSGSERTFTFRVSS